MKSRIVQANLNNQGGAFSIVYEIQKKIGDEYIFDYFSSEKFINNTIYQDLVDRGGICFGGVESKGRFVKQITVYKAFKNFVSQNSYQFVHIHSDTSWKMLVYYFAARNAGIDNIIVHSHSSGIAGHHRVINYILHFICRPIIKKARYRCACSDVAAEWMFGTLKNVLIIQNGVDVEKFKYNEEKRHKIRNRYKIKDKIKIIGSVSDFSYPKNPEFIFRLIKYFRDKEDFIFMLVGNREGCELKKWVERNKDISNVIFVGQVTDVEAYLSAMDIFILPSRFEGLPMCALEAQVNGLYTVISDNITAETERSCYFRRIELKEKKWIEEIESADTAYDRNFVENYLQKDKIASDRTVMGVREIYKKDIKMDELITVIIPVYNVEPYLDRCLKSIQHQTYRNLEIILVDDKSNDRSNEMCLDYLADSRVILVHGIGEGLSGARNRGLDIASGKYVVFVDSDDYAELTMIEHLYNCLKENRADTVIGGFRRAIGSRIEIRENRLADVIYEGHDEVMNRVLKKMLGWDGHNHIEMSVWKSIFSMDIIRNNNLRFPDKKYLCEDIIFDFGYFEFAQRVAMSNDTGYCYCLNSESLSQMYQENKFEKITFQAKEMRRLAQKDNFDDEAFLRIDNFYVGNLIHHMKTMVASKIGYRKCLKENKKILDTVTNESIDWKNWERHSKGKIVFHVY